MPKRTPQTDQAGGAILYKINRRAFELSDLSLACALTEFRAHDANTREQLRDALYGFEEHHKGEVFAHKSETWLPSEAEADALGKELKRLFEKLCNKQEVPIPKIAFDLTAHNDRDGLKLTYRGDLRSAFLLFVLRELQEHGVDPVRRCTYCRRFFVAINPRQKFCLRRCGEADKLRRYKATPSGKADYNEVRNLLMWKRGNNVKPNQRRIEGWIVKYRERQKRRKRTASTRPIAEVAKRYA